MLRNRWFFSPAHAPKRTDAKSDAGVEQLLSTLNSAAQRIQSLWISFISFGAYLTITVLGTTHRMLLLEEPVKLPLFNIDLPLTSFYLIAPTFLLIFHFYVMVQLLLLARTASAFEDAVKSARMRRAELESLKMRVDNSIFLQLIAGAEAERSGRNSWLLRPVAWLTIVILPAALFMLIELQFLPYHHEGVTWLHRALFIADLLFLMLLWPAYSAGRGLISNASVAPGFSGLRSATRTLSSVVLILVVGSLGYFACVVISFPSESIYDGNAMTRMLLERGVDYVTGRPRGYFSNRLVVPDQRFVDDKVVREMDEAEKDLEPGQFRTLRSFRGRDLVLAVLSRSDLRRSDFTAANMEGAVLSGASLQRSRFGSLDDGLYEEATDKRDDAVQERAVRPKKRENETILDSAKLDFAKLQYAYFDRVLADRVVFDSAELEGIWARRAQLRGASMFGAKLVGANLELAKMQGVDLSNSDLRGASLERGHFEGASFERADLKFARLSDARLNAAVFDGAKLSGASFVRSNLMAASLKEAELQSADFDTVTARGTSFKNAAVWRTNMRNIRAGELEVSDLKFAPNMQVPPAPPGLETQSGFPEAKFAQWRNLTLKDISAGRLRQSIFNAAQNVDPDSPDPADWGVMKSFWDERAKNNSAELYQKALGELLFTLACAKENAPFVARGIIRNSRINATGHYADDLMRALRLEPGARPCPGAAGLEEDDYNLLR